MRERGRYARWRLFGFSLPKYMLAHDSHIETKFKSRKNPKNVLPFIHWCCFHQRVKRRHSDELSASTAQLAKPRASILPLLSFRGSLSAFPSLQQSRLSFPPWGKTAALFSNLPPPTPILGKNKFFFFFSVLKLQLRAFTLSHSTSPIFVKGFSR
jgi:hypothetical protein